MPILGDFAVKYSTFANALGISMSDLYQALVDTAENTVCMMFPYVHPSLHIAFVAPRLVERYPIMAARPVGLNSRFIVGRQNTAWKMFGYIPTNWVDPSGSTGLETREASRAFEVSVH